MPEHIAAIALGSNLPSEFGDREQNLNTAIERLAPLGHILAVSPFFDTAPIGLAEQPRFLNGALLLQTSLVPGDLMHTLLDVERGMGRRRENVPVNGPRIIDLDFLFYDQLTLDTPELSLPHPAMAERLFVLQPLAEIAPTWLHPSLHKTVAQLLAHLRGQATAES